jgi:RNA polymerase sigma-70 factor (ECF subfamily)
MSDELNSDPRSAFPRLWAKHDPSLRSFVRASLPDPHDLAEVMQNVSVIAWKKFSDLEDAENGFGPWVSVIARYEILKFRRSKARDRLVLDEDVAEKLLDEPLDSFSMRSEWLLCLSSCLKKLRKDHQSLLQEAYASDMSIKKLAEQRKRKPNALYQTLSRLRSVLADCIEKEMLTKGAQ